MSAKTLTLLTVSLIAVLLFSGCGQQAEIAMKFAQDDVTVYKVTTSGLQDYKFAQPSLDKVKEYTGRGNISEITFTQQIESVDADGNAIAKITVDEFKYTRRGESEVEFEFDSTNDKQKRDPLNRIVGKSYKIKIAKDGNVTVVDAEDIRTAASTKRLKNFVSDASIVERHRVQGLYLEKPLTKGKSWSTIMIPNYRVMVAKTYDKQFTLEKIEETPDGNLAYVTMKGLETAEKAQEGRAPKGTEMFAGIFDSEEVYEGQMILDLSTGKVVSYGEKLIADYFSADISGDSEKPDQLDITLTFTIDVEMVK